MATKRIIEDRDFEKIIIRTHRLARNITMRIKGDGLYVTTPPYTLTKKVVEVVNQFRESLLEKWTKVRVKPIDIDYNISAPCFKLQLEIGNINFFSVKNEDEIVKIICPNDVDFSSFDVQKLLKNAVVRALRKRASEYLPPLIEELSNQYSLPYKCVKINASRGRWGSCSSRKSINLSCYLMLLPSHLMDYVILHELAHTKEMNHGPQFWSLLDKLTEQRSKLLRSELRQYSLKHLLSLV